MSALKLKLRSAPQVRLDLSRLVPGRLAGLSLAEIERWIYTMGLIAYFQEGKRPQYSEAISRKIELPEV